MQAHHRRRHRIAWVVLTVVIAAAIVVALSARRPAPAVDTLPVPASIGDAP